MRNTHTSLLLSLSLAACTNHDHDTLSPPSGSGSGSGSSDAALTIASTGFFVDGDRWLTATSGPVLTGKAQGSGARVSVVVAGKQIGAPIPVVDGDWAVPLPTGTILPKDTTVEVDLLGTPTKATQVIVFDDSMPTVANAATSIRDELGDSIDFSSGAPKHDHQGAAIALGSGCPDVHVYPYLHGQMPPLFGSEVAANPLTFAFRGMAPFALGGAARYRVTAGASTVLDWTAAPAIAADGSLAITIVRDGVHAVPLDTLAGAVTVEVEYADWDGRTTTASACWTNHPLAAPLQIGATGIATGVGEITGLALGNNTPVSDLIELNAAPVDVYLTSIVQTTAEPIILDISFAPPSATYRDVSVVKSIHPASATGAIPCGNGCAPGSRFCTQAPPTDARCNLAPVVLETPTSMSGTVTTGTWSQTLVGASFRPCTQTSATEMRCTIPPRDPNGGPLVYTLVQSLAGVTDLKAYLGTYTEKNVFGFAFTGIDPWVFSHCDNLVTAPPNSLGVEAMTCAAWTTYTGIAGLYSAHIDFAATSMTFSAGTNPATLAPITYTSTAIPPISWDGGADNLM
jgi:hypothetical protein